MEIRLRIPLFRTLSARIQAFISDREISIPGRQRLSVYLYASYIMIGVIPLLLLAMPQDLPIFIWANAIIWCTTILLLAAYYFHVISLTTAINLLALFVEAELVVEMVSCVSGSFQYSTSLLLTDLFLSAVVVILSATAYLHYMPYLLSTMAMGAYTYAMIVTGDLFLQNFCAVFWFVFLIICLLGTRILRNITRLEQENEGLRNDEKEMLWLLRMDKEQVRAFVELSKNETPQRTGELLDMVGDRIRHNIIKTVSAWQKQKEIENTDMLLRFPELTPSEREICGLILQDKKQNEICRLLNKSASNINSQRTHIRKKLGLSTGDDLKKALQQRMD